MRGTLIVSADPEALYDVAAEKVAEALEAAAAEREIVRWALAGGHTPRPLYERLAAAPWSERIPWEQIHVFWGDERVVPHVAPDSNYRMIKESLLSAVPIPRENIHAVDTHWGARKAAADYEAALRAHFRVRRGFPVFDLALLGVGADGHVASLFPHTPALDEPQSLVVTARGHGGLARVSLSLPLLNRSRKIFLLAIGKEKAEAVRRGAEETGRLPVQRIQPEKGELIWLLDQEAAAELSQVRVHG